MIEKLIQSMQNLQDVDVLIGFGPNHPTHPDKQKSEIINVFFNKFPLLNKYPDYVIFMKKYAGMYILHPQDGFSLDLVGFSNISSDLMYINGEFLWLGESNIVLNNYLVFCGGVLKPTKIPINKEDMLPIGSGFAFDMNNPLNLGVYRAVDPNTTGSDDFIFEFYCQTFSEWLELIIKYEGVLPYNINH